MNPRVLRLAGVFGIAAPIFGFLVIASSIWLSPWFSWTGNALSDLGGAGGLGMAVFNYGLVATGILLTIFGIGLLEMTKGDMMGQLGSAIYLLAEVFLIGIGIFNITIEPWHFYVSVGFFVTLPISATLNGVFCYRNSMRFYAMMAWGAAVLAAGIWFLHWEAVAIPEAMSALYITVWQIFLAYWIYTRKSDLT